MTTGFGRAIGMEHPDIVTSDAYCFFTHIIYYYFITNFIILSTACYIYSLTLNFVTYFLMIYQLPRIL